MFAALLVGAIAGAVGAHSATAACSKNSWRSLVLISAQTGAVDRSFPDVNGNVNVVLADGRGGWFVGGGFGCVGKVAVPGLVHLHSDGTLDTAWQAALPRTEAIGTPNALAAKSRARSTQGQVWFALPPCTLPFQVRSQSSRPDTQTHQTPKAPSPETLIPRCMGPG